MTGTRYEPLLASQMIVRGSQRFLATMRTEAICPAMSKDFLLQLQQLKYAALLEMLSLRQSQSGAP